MVARRANLSFFSGYTATRLTYEKKKSAFSLEDTTREKKGLRCAGTCGQTRQTARPGPFVEVCVCVYVGIMYVSFVCMRVCVVFVLVYTGLRFVCEVMR